jgi:hypothetical protein
VAVPLVEPLSLPPVCSGVRVTRSLVLCVMFCRSLFVLFLLAIVLFVVLRFTDSDYPPLVSSNKCRTSWSFLCSIVIVDIGGIVDHHYSYFLFTSCI